MKYRIEYRFAQLILSDSKREFDVRDEQEAKVYFKEFVRVSGILPQNLKLLRIDQEEKTTLII